MIGTMAHAPFRFLAILGVSLLCGLAHAQDNEPYADDPPERAARLSFISGDVSLQPAGETDWTAALINRPLTTGDKLWTEQNARAEIYVGPAAVRLDEFTGFSFLNVDNDTIQMRVTAGVLNVNVRTLDGGEHIEIATPNVALTLLRAGNYRVEVNDAGDATVVKVSEGSVQATGGRQDSIVYSQQVATFTGTDDVIAQYGTLGAPDDFDSWSLERDRRDELAANSPTTEYVSPEVTGYQDLNQYGSWASEPGYGYVWAPTYVNVGWAPYRYGRWVSIAPWGWTWVDDAPWGYAPFHYGRWAHIRHRWCWVPGPRHVRPVYAPALVGWGPAHGGNVSWFPLGPREAYVPGHHFSRNYVERVNYSNTVVARSLIREVYEDRGANIRFQNRVADAVTATSSSQFTSAGRVGPQRIRLSDKDLETGPARSIAPRVVAGRQGRLGGPARTNVRVPPPTVANRQVVVRRDPPSSAAHFARRAVERDEVARAPDRAERPRDRSSFNGGRDQGQPNATVDTARERADRPSRVDRPVSESAPPQRSSVFDREALSGRVRADRDRQVREVQEQREAAGRNSWQQTEQSRAGEDRPQQDRPPREQTQRSRELERQLRDQVQRQQEMRPDRQRQPEVRPDTQRRQTDYSQVERPRYEQPRVEQPRYEPRHEQPRAQQPRVEQPRYEQPRQEQPRQEQPRREQSQPRSEPPREQHQRSENRSSESRSPSNNRSDYSRPNRN